MKTSAPPRLDKRRSSALYNELLSIAKVMLPQWQADQKGAELLTALFKTSAQMAENITLAIDSSPQRDQIAFFDMLDIPAEAPRPAQCPIAFLLSDKQKKSVFAARGTQVAASGDDGEIVFETAQDFFLTPSRLNFIAAVDGDEDRIELAPPNFLELAAAPGPLPIFKASSFSKSGSKFLQIEPLGDLTAGDVIKVNSAAYHIEQEDEGIYALTPALEADVDPAKGALIEKVTTFDTFTLRNQQKHYFYIGHNELFNLEQASTIYLEIEPLEVIQNLLSSDIQWQMYGVHESEEEPRWLPINAKLADNGQLELEKYWRGSVEALAINNIEALWIRAEYTEKISQEKILGTRVNRLKIGVKSLSETAVEVPTETISACDCNNQTTDTGTGTDNAVSTATTSELSEGSLTITQAFHNGTPLPLSSRFLPFGPEPRRFDTFAMAIPEVLSKKNAAVTLAVTLPDSSIQHMAFVQKLGGPERAYGVSSNGALQGLMFDDDINKYTWIEIGQPQIEDLDSGDDDTTLNLLSLDSSLTPQSFQAINYYAIQDNVVVRDRRGAWWVLNIYIDLPGEERFSKAVWNPLTPAATTAEISRDYSVLRRGNPYFSPFSFAVVLAVFDNTLKRMEINTSYRSGDPAFNDIVPTDPISAPDVDTDSRIILVQSPNWPQPKASFPMEVVVLDKNQNLWLADIEKDNDPVNWQNITVPGVPLISPQIRPSVMRHASNNDLVIFAANDQLAPFTLSIDTVADTAVVFAPSTSSITTGSEIHCYPSALYGEPLAVFWGKTDGQASASLWSSNGELGTLALPEPRPESPSVDSGFIYQNQDLPELVLNRVDESVLRNRLGQVVQYEHHHWITRNNQSNVNLIEVDVAANAVFFPYQVLLDFGSDTFILPNNIFGGATPSLTNWILWAQLGAFSGTSVDGGTQVQLDNSDGTTQLGSVFIIENKRFVVDIFDALNKVATLNQSSGIATGDPINYTLLDTSGPVDVVAVTADNVNTALKIIGATTLPEFNTPIIFNTGSANRQRRLSRTIEDSGEFWGLLNTAWANPFNPPQVDALLLNLDTVQWTEIPFPRGYQNPELAWEYFDGSSWRRLENKFVDGSNQLANSGDITFTVPHNLAPVEIAGQEDYWIRTRLIGGDYGQAQYIVETDTVSVPNTQTINVNTDNLRPPEILRIEANFSLLETVPAEFVLVQNNLGFHNSTQASQVENAQFELFEGATKINQDSIAVNVENTQGENCQPEPKSCYWKKPGSCSEDEVITPTTEDVESPLAETAKSQRVVYFGFSQAFQVGQLSFYIDAEDQIDNVPLDFEILMEEGWRRVSHADESQGFHRRAYLQVAIEFIPRKYRLFGQDLFWLRARPSIEVAAWAPRLHGVFVNAIAAEQVQTRQQEMLGSSSGEKSQQFSISQSPVLPPSFELRVREKLTVEERATLLAADKDAVTQYPALSIEGDWIKWRAVESFIGQEQTARVFKLDPMLGIVTFGAETKIPPPGRDNVRVIRYQTGGGTVGNVDAYNIGALKSDLPGVETVANPVRAAGGTEPPVLSAQISDAPARIRHSGHALSPTDIEALAVATSPRLVQARCLFPTEINSKIQVAIAVDTGAARCPQPSLADRQSLAELLRERAWGGLDEEEIEIVGPTYVAISLRLELQARTLAEAASLEQQARQRLSDLLDPIKGGPAHLSTQQSTQQGWPFARRLWESDILRCLAQIPSFDRILGDIEISTIDPCQQLDNMPTFGLICAENNNIELTVNLTQGGSR